MTKESELTSLYPIHSDLKIVKELVYDRCNFDFLNLRYHLESMEYGACSFELNGKTIQYRVSKITPTKTGQFVTIWKRNEDGITEPFDISDELDFMIITSRSDENFGQFIFPKSVLADHGIITKNSKAGKRGIRVYPPSDITTNKQAAKTQSWQTRYFLTLKSDSSNELNLIKNLLIETSEIG